MRWSARICSDGYWWAGIEVKGEWMPFYRVGQKGHCVRF